MHKLSYGNFLVYLLPYKSSHFHMKGCAVGLVFKWSGKPTWKLLIALLYLKANVLIIKAVLKMLSSELWQQNLRKSSLANGMIVLW